MTGILRIRALEVSYSGQDPVVCGIDLDVADGQSLAIVGESGCGKTSCLRAIIGLLGSRDRVSGSIDLLGTELTTMPSRKRRRLAGTQIGYVAQDPYLAFDPLRTVRHHVQEPLRMRGQHPDPVDTIQQLTEVGIPDAADRSRQHPHQWSGGMLQRATIMASTTLNPVVTLADEPTSALDADLADPVMETLRRRSRSLLFVTHDLSLAARHADQIVVMHESSVVESGRPARVLNDPRHDRTRALVSAAQPPSRHVPLDLPSGEETDTVVCAQDISRTYPVRRDHQTAVDRTSLTVTRGEIVGIVGASGSGKSTLLRLLAGIEPTDTGSVRYNTDHAPLPRAGEVMPIFQDPTTSLDPRWPLWRTVTEPRAAQHKLPRRSRKSMARESLDAVELPAVSVDAYPGQLSTGQAQRVAIARALAAGPDLIVADEPTASLDVSTARDTMLLLRTVSDTQATAQVLVSHDVALLDSVADRILTMKAGNLSHRDLLEITE